MRLSIHTRDKKDLKRERYRRKIVKDSGPLGWLQKWLEGIMQDKTRTFTFFLGDEGFAAGLTAVLFAGAFLAAALTLAEAVVPVTV